MDIESKFIALLCSVKEFSLTQQNKIVQIKKGSLFHALYLADVFWIRKTIFQREDLRPIPQNIVPY